MSRLEKSIAVNVPVRVVYNQWTQFEEFPYLMDGVLDVKQLDDRRVHWRVKVGSKEKEFDAEITEQIPDHRIAWRSISGSKQAGVVTFHRLGENRSRVMLQLEFEPESMIEKVGDRVGFISSRVERDLENFKKFIESRQRETGGWRGEIHLPS
jgi:uncharacterized membrane protein